MISMQSSCSNRLVTVAALAVAATAATLYIYLKFRKSDDGKKKKGEKKVACDSWCVLNPAVFPPKCEVNIDQINRSKFSQFFHLFFPPPFRFLS